MQRSKIEVGEEYALATWRDWDKYRGHARRVQVLDAKPWENVARYRADVDTEEAEVVSLPGGGTVEVSKRYRRRRPMPYDRGRGLGTLVLIRQWVPAANGNRGAWGEPTTAETRTLVATWAEAEVKMAAHQQAEEERLSAARAEKSRRKDRQGRINERLRDLNLDRQVILERSRISTGDVSTVTADLLEALLTLAERGFEDTREFEPEGS